MHLTLATIALILVAIYVVGITLLIGFLVVDELIYSRRRKAAQRDGRPLRPIVH